MAGARYIFVEPIELLRILLDSSPAFRPLVPGSGKPILSRTLGMGEGDEFDDGPEIGRDFDTVRDARRDSASSNFRLPGI
jgi:hypothetical protein